MIFEFGDRLTKLRLGLGLTVTELSKKTGISESMICRYENNERKPSLEVLRKLVVALNTTADYLLDINKGNPTAEIQSGIKIDISDLTPKQVKAVLMIIEQCRELNSD